MQTVGNGPARFGASRTAGMIVGLESHRAMVALAGTVMGEAPLGKATPCAAEKPGSEEGCAARRRGPLVRVTRRRFTQMR